jgi:AraC-like DNA-binding protein
MLDLYYKDIKKHIHFMHIPVKFRYTEFHLHEYFEIYFFISGNARYFIENTIYSLSHGDLLVTNNNEIHKSMVVPTDIYDVISVQIDPSFLKSLSSSNCNLLDCFINRTNGQNNRIFLQEDHLNTVTTLFKKIENIYFNTSFGSEILLTAYLMELLVVMNSCFKGNIQDKEPLTVPDKLSLILEHINFNLNDDLSLEALEYKFHINRFYLSRLFKKTTGSTLHEYILLKRLSLAKTLLKEGKSVTETCELSGFNDYFHFIRIFKKYIGTSPGQFKNSSIY